MSRLFALTVALMLSVPAAYACVDEGLGYYTDLARAGTQLPEDHLRGYSCEALWEMRNAVYARHGYAFTTDKAKTHFAQFRWYERNESVTATTVEPLLTRIDKKNVEMVQEREKTCRDRAVLEAGDMH